ncbi:Potassium-transporting ATPase ATP-binding subunit [Stutzerimonas stutzeri]
MAEPDSWHAQPAEQILQQLDSTHSGLSAEQAQQRLQQFGPNRLPQRQGNGALKRLLMQFHNLLIYVLLLSALVTLALGEWLDSAVIVAVVVINALVGFIQEGKAEQAMRAIQKLLTLDSRVRRAGHTLSVPAEELVPGDLVLLEPGDRVHADPPREEAIAAIAECQRAGIAVKMITGDHAATAAAIAQRLGLGEQPPLTGAELDRLSDAELDARLAQTAVFARTSPAHKLRLVQRLQACGARVAMTGDGVNERAGAQARRYRRGDGHQGHRGGQGGGTDGAGRR